MSLGHALKRSWLVVVACVLLCAGAATAVGLLRQPQYTTDAQLYVGTFDVRTLSRSGIVTASQQLAVAYSRLALTEPVVGPVARQLGLTSQEILRRVSAAHIPGSPVVRIEARGPTRADTVALARAMSAQLAAYVTRFTSREGEASSLLQRFKAETRRASVLEARAAGLREAGADGRTVRDAQAEAETARLRATALAGLYGDARASTAGAVDAHVIQAGYEVTDDRLSVLQLLVFGGVLSGLVLGTALAALRQRRLVLQR
jgi:capsular polysaccharide biosynthesis protein